MIICYYAQLLIMLSSSAHYQLIISSSSAHHSFISSLSSAHQELIISSSPQSSGSSRRGRSVLPPVQPLVAGAPFTHGLCCCCQFLVFPSVCLSMCGTFIALLLLCAHLACASAVRDSECATTMLGWRNEHVDFGFENRPEKI